MTLQPWATVFMMALVTCSSVSSSSFPRYVPAQLQAFANLQLCMAVNYTTKRLSDTQCVTDQLRTCSSSVCRLIRLQHFVY